MAAITDIITTTTSSLPWRQNSASDTIRPSPMAAAEFSGCVELGVQLSKRIYYGKELRPSQSLSLSQPEAQAMMRSVSGSVSVSAAAVAAAAAEEFLPSAPMAYAEVPEPAIVDNPDVPSYQPYVHGRCEPPALVPLHLHGVALDVDARLDVAFVSLAATWRVHCVMAAKRCDCRFALPLGSEKGSLLGVEVEVDGRSYRSRLIPEDEIENASKSVKRQDGRLLKGQIYTFKVPQVDGGSNISIKATWSQPIAYELNQFCLRIPFSFPHYVNPVGKKISKLEKISMNINPGTGIEVLCKSSSHPLKNLKREAGKLSSSYEAEVPVWSCSDFCFSYSLSSGDLFGGVLVQSPLLRDFEDREMFCLYLFPGTNPDRKEFKKEVVFVIDTSGSMKGGPLESVKNTLLASLSNLNPEDTFNIVAFDGEFRSFSTCMEFVTKEAVLKATEWADINLVPKGGTNILLPLEHAFKLLAKASDSIPLIFLVTDGSVEDEREICNIVNRHVTNSECISPRICTLGIGSYCNHYFLHMLAETGKGYYDAAYDIDSIEPKLQRLFTIASSVTVADITVDAFKDLDSLELFPSNIPDLSSEIPLILSGKYYGNLPNVLTLKGKLADKSNFAIELKPLKSKDLPLNKVLARRQIDMHTSHAWLTENKELQEKAARISEQTGVPSEYTFMLLTQPDQGKKAPESDPRKELNKVLKPWKRDESIKEKALLLGGLGIGFGDVAATASNKPSVTVEVKTTEATDILMKAASGCCDSVLERICCMCFLRTCTYVNDRAAILLAQLCTGLACCSCLNCCYELCA